MIYMKEILDKVLECEDKYMENFCTYIDEGNYRRYFDDKLRDMYDHNFIKLNYDLDNNEVENIIKAETNKRYEANAGFCKITLGNTLKGIPSPFKEVKPEIEHLGAYVYTEGVSNWKSIDECGIKKVSNECMVNELINLDLAHDAETCGVAFCNRRALRKGKVYLDTNKLCDSYNCYYNNVPVGNCELMIYNDTAKIELFAVHPDYQRKGIGTTILKYLVSKAVMDGAKVVYLIADEDDTPKEMYIKLGFKKVSDIYSLLWKF